MAIHDFDRMMVNVSSGLHKDLMVDRLIGNIRVYITKQGYETITNEINHLVTLELLARKLGIVLEKAKEMLKATN